MKRTDLAVIVSLALLASFVGREALGARVQARLADARTASFGATRLTDGASDSGSATGTRQTGRPSKPTVDNTGEVRRRIELGAPGTYIGDVLLTHDSALTRWPDRQANPLRVWVQPSSQVTDFSYAFVPLVRQAFMDWSGTGIPLAFTFVTDSSSADVHVTWIDRFAESISGKTLWAHDENWWIVDAQIQLALHHRSGEALDASAVRAIALHEVGHLIGLDHTPDTTAIMTPRVRVKELSSLDRATAMLLYRLPPGRLGTARVHTH